MLLGFGVAIELACCVGVLVMDDAYDKLHYLGPAADPRARSRSPPRSSSGSPSPRPAIKALLTAGLLIVASPVLTHATARALYIRQRDHLEPSRGRRR